VRYRRFLLVSLVLAAAFGINTVPGCGALRAEPDAWNEYPTHKPLPAVVMRVSAQEVLERCRRKNVMGCAIRDEANGVCVIYVDYKPLPGTELHELFHCAGWDHT
jgi:hypothetical protein